MEDSKRIYKFYGKPGEDFHLWAARTEAALEAKNVLEMIESDILAQGDPDEELKKKIASARAVVIQGLGDRPLRLCLSAKDDPFKMWNKLKYRYAVSNTATKVQLQTRLSRMSYRGQAMQDYVDSFEEVFNRLAAMNSEIGEDLQVAMLLASFGDKKSSPFGHLIASMQTMQDKLGWETATAGLLQEYEDQILRAGGSKSSRILDTSQALSANRSPKYYRSRKFQAARREKRRCFVCHKIGHLAKNCVQREPKVTGRWQYSNETADIAVAEEGGAQTACLLLTQGKTIASASPGKGNNIRCHACWSIGHSHSVCWKYPSFNELDIYRSHFDCDEDYLEAATAIQNPCDTARSSFILDSGASDHMVWCLNWLRNVREVAPRAIILGDGNRLIATHQGTLVLRTVIGSPGDQYERTVTLHNVLCVPQLRSNLLSCSKLCESGYRVTIRHHKCNGLLDGIIQFEGRMVGGVYRVRATPLHPLEQRSCAATAMMTTGRKDDDDDNHSIKLWHARFGHANVDTIRQLARINAVYSAFITHPRTLEHLCLQ